MGLYTKAPGIKEHAVFDVFSHITGDEASSYLTDPVFVGCMRNDCDGVFFGPFFRLDYARKEANNTCPCAHLIGRNISPKLPVYSPSAARDMCEADKMHKLLTQDYQNQKRIHRARE